MWFNPLIIFLLKSPLHPILSNDTMLVSYTSTKSGKRFSLPVNFARRDDQLYSTSFQQRTWWRRFRTEAPAELLVAGEKLQAVGRAYPSSPASVEKLAELVRINPVYAKYLKIQLDPDGNPDKDDVFLAAEGRVVIQFQILQNNV